jgi:hypothetical protein
MKSKVAVATVHGKAYFLIVTELKRRGIQFLSLIPGESIPEEIRVVVTTSLEKPRIAQGKILVYDPGMEPEVLGGEVLKALQGKENYATIAIGMDPRQVIGLAVAADGAIIESDNYFSIRDTITRVKNVLKTVDFSRTAVIVKIGNGVPVFRKMLHAMDEELPPQVGLEIVEESGTNRYKQEAKHRRVFRHLVSAARIA